MSNCILVGNGKQDRKLGEVIDSFEHVYRFNRFKVKGFAEYVGTRCTHWILNNALIGRNYFTDHIKRIEQRHPEFIQTTVITERNNNLNKLKELKSQYKNFTYIIYKDRIGKKKMSSGILAIVNLVDSYDCISLVGFDFGKSNHYWGNHGPADRPGAHDWIEEERYVNKLIQDKKVEIL